MADHPPAYLVEAYLGISSVQLWQGTALGFPLEYLESFGFCPPRAAYPVGKEDEKHWNLFQEESIEIPAETKCKRNLAIFCSYKKES